MLAASVLRFSHEAHSRRHFLKGVGAVAGGGLVAGLTPGKAFANGDGAKNVVEAFLAPEVFHAPLPVDLLLSFLSEDIVFENTGMPDIVGHDAIRAFAEPISLIFSEFTNETRNIIWHDHLVAVERAEFYRVRDDAPFGIPGASVLLRTNTWFEVDNGLITRWFEGFDRRTIETFLGIDLGPLVP